MAGRLGRGGGLGHRGQPRGGLSVPPLPGGQRDLGGVLPADAPGVPGRQKGRQGRSGRGSAMARAELFFGFCVVQVRQEKDGVVLVCGVVWFLRGVVWFWCVFVL